MSLPLIVIDNVLKVLGGFILGWGLRDITSRGQEAGQGQKSKGKAGSKKTSVARPREELKMVLCVNEALKMGKGKIGAQCAHAACGVYQKYSRKPAHEAAFKQWEYCGQAKIALKINDDEEMDALAEKASAAGMPTYIVCDAGRTQIPAGSQTVLAIGPAPKSKLDSVTGHLRLL